ncbi:MAG: four helix bundle protein [Pyrinomonadaceae bacterium]
MAAEVHLTGMTEDEFKTFTKKLALQVIELFQDQKFRGKNRILADQLIQSVTTMAAMYRSACRERTTSTLLTRLLQVEAETERSLFILELFVDSNVLRPEQLIDITGDLDEILRLTSSSIVAISRKQ